MFRSNIKGLATILNKIDRRLDVLEKEKFQVRSGQNTFVKQTGNVFTINSKASGETSVSNIGYYPWKMYTVNTAEGDQDPIIKLRIKGGLINGLLPDNMEEDLQTLTEGSEYMAYVECDFSGAVMNSMTFKTATVGSEPNMEYDYKKDSPPQKFRHMIGITKDKNIADQYLRKNLKVRPALAYRQVKQDDTNIVDNYWTWDIYPL